MRYLVIALLLMALLGGVRAGADPEIRIAGDSLEKLQDTLGAVRDYLWDIDDHFFHEGDYERCIAITRLITQLDPHDIEAYTSGAWLMQNQLRDDEAEAYLRQGLENNRDTPDMYFELGYFLYMHERFGEAIDNFETAITFDTHWRTWHMLAHAYEHSGNKCEAFSIWLRMEARDPENTVPKIQIERILAGEPPSVAPEMARHAREQRKKEAEEGVAR